MEIFPGLPDDIGRECLLRVPLTSHPTMALVCKRWKNIVCSLPFYQDRKRFGEFIILPCWDDITNDKGCRIKIYDPLQNSIETLPPFPPQFPHFSACSFCIPFNHKLIVTGLFSSLPEFTIHKALVIYNFSSGKWKRGPDLPDCRVNFSCSVDSAKGLIYIAGGCDSDGEELYTAAIYDIEEEKWEYLPPMIWSECTCHSVFTDDKLYVVNHMEGHIQAYDPNTGQWSAICDCYYDGSMQPSFAAFGRIYHEQDGEIIEWDYVENQFRIAGTLPPQVFRFLGGTMWNQQILMVCIHEEATNIKGWFQNVKAFYLFEPSYEGGKEEKWTLISTLSATELPDIIPTIGALTL